MPDYIILAIVIAVCLAIAVLLIRTRKFIRSFIFSAVTGNIALFCVAYMGAFTGFIISINLFTVTVSSILGIPGVIGMLLLRLIFQS